MDNSAISSNRTDELCDNSLLKNRNFILHFFGSTISGFGDAFTLVALPWLVLEVTNSPIHLGLIMAAAGVPRAIVMLLGGALIDKVGAAATLLWSRVMFFILLSVLASLIWQQNLELWMLYAFSFASGVLGAFALPAAESLLPLLVKQLQLPKANGLILGGEQFGYLIAPAISGGMIWWVSNSNQATGHELDGLALIFAIDALTFLFAVISLLAVKLKRQKKATINYSFWKMTIDGFRHIKQDQSLLAFTIFLMLFGFLGNGPFFGLMPLFAKQNFTDGSATLGVLMSINGAGAITGILIGSLLRPKPSQLGPFLMSGYLLTGLGFASLSATDGMLSASITIYLTGMGCSWSMVAGISWIQVRVPETLLGRAISIIMFAFLGLVPLSISLNGFMANYFNVQNVMLVYGTLLALVSVLALTLSSIRSMGVTSGSSKQTFQGSGQQELLSNEQGVL